jgi:hypothetical protein
VTVVGAARRIDPTAVQVTDLSETHTDQLAKAAAGRRDAGPPGRPFREGAGAAEEAAAVIHGRRLERPTRRG